jgi:hypothetical protein
MRLTQRQRLLTAFQERGELYVYEIMAPRPAGLGISQYGARILELRHEGHQIINKEPGHFIYKTDTAERKNMDGYAKFQAMGQFLKGKTENKPEPEYDKLTVEELTIKKQVAEVWLDENRNSKNYEVALKRYERLCDHLTMKENLL